MRRHLDRIRFRGQRRDEFLDLAESPNTSDTECTEEVVLKPRGSLRDVDEPREAEGEPQSDAQVHTHKDTADNSSFTTLHLESYSKQQHALRHVLLPSVLIYLCLHVSEPQAVYP